MARQHVHLTYQYGNSNKFWEGEVNGRVFTARWGKIGTTGQTKSWTCSSDAAALAQFETKVDEKVRKGYVHSNPSGQGPRQPTAPATPVGPPTLKRPSRVEALLADEEPAAPAKAPAVAPPALRPMLAEETDQNKLVDFAEDDAWWAEQKLDGHRVLLEVGNGRGTAIGRDGQSSQHAALFMQTAYQGALGSLPVDAVLDGELVDGVLWVFDLPWTADGIEPKTPFTDRRERLEKLFADWSPPEPCFRLLPTAKDRRAKTELAMECLRQGGEGVMLKKTDGKYVSSVRVRHVLKAKFVREADFVVTQIGWRGKDNYCLGLYRDGKLTEVGRCSAIGKEKCDVGDVVLVRYLYIGADGRLYQPRMMRRRTDKGAEECLYDQIANHGVNKKVFA